jgi:3-deoxy-manno-octulosonate cytidylyltransferase (CMP-KDO synthetase)
MSVIIIPARYASERLPGKPLLKIGGVPMILRVAEQCLKTVADRVIVVTDDKRILETCESQDGLECTMSDPEIPSGTDRVAGVAKYIDDEIIINVQGDEPFIKPELVDELVKCLEEDETVSMITACVPFAEDGDDTDPNAVKVVTDEQGNALYFSRLPVPFSRDGKKIQRYRHIGIYGFRRDFLLKFASMPQGFLEETEKLEQLRALEAGVKIRVVKTDYRPISVDTAEDLKKCEDYCKGLENG